MSEPRAVDLDEGDRLLARRDGYEKHTLNYRCVDADLSDWLDENGPAMLAQLRTLRAENERLRAKGESDA
jgi:hypothetical protein